MPAQVLHADNAWLPDGWSERVRIEVEAQGRFVSVASGAPRSDAEALGRWVLPGMPNLHSHAFQRAMAGLAERRGREDDNFWTWREVMYAFASRVGPEQLKAIAAQLYVEMLKAGYTHVCEFHYLHGRPDGKAYDDPATMSLALIEAAQEAGIGMTLLPTLYMTGGFDGRKLGERQQRFGMSVDDFLALIEQLRDRESDMLRVGIGLHSLRAVPADALRTVLAAQVAGHGPVHMHIAEQIGEVQDCLAVRDARPVEWLLDHAEVGRRWCLIHATHADAAETRRVADTGAVVCLCPTTEANLGDGFFPLPDYLEANGMFGIGSDSHISISPVEELRWLEYGQRLRSRHRNIAARESGASVGAALWRSALAGGARGSGAAVARIDEAPAEDQQAPPRADLIVLDETSPLLAGRRIGNLLDSFIFAGNTPLVRDVMVNGCWQVRDFRHRDEEAIAQRFRDTVEELCDA